MNWVHLWFKSMNHIMCAHCAHQIRKDIRIFVWFKNDSSNIILWINNGIWIHCGMCGEIYRLKLIQLHRKSAVCTQYFIVKDLVFDIDCCSKNKQSMLYKSIKKGRIRALCIDTSPSQISLMRQYYFTVINVYNCPFKKVLKEKKRNDVEWHVTYANCMSNICYSNYTDIHKHTYTVRLNGSFKRWHLNFCQGNCKNDAFPKILEWIFFEKDIIYRHSRTHTFDSNDLNGKRECKVERQIKVQWIYKRKKNHFENVQQAIFVRVKISSIIIRNQKRLLLYNEQVIKQASIGERQR